MSKTLIIMAAGMGSRFGGGKQTAGLGPNGEMLMEYSIYDAKLAGFDNFVFIISEAMNEFFPAIIKERVPNENLMFAVQSFGSLPEWYELPADRTKPYGTVHAVLAARGLVNEPFAVINADDFYGRPAYSDLAEAMDRLADSGEACMLTYPIASTLSGTGGVTRGICHVNAEGALTGIDETHDIRIDSEGNAYAADESGKKTYIENNAPASMNIFGFKPWMMDAMARGFDEFLLNIAPDKKEKAEYPIPILMDKLISDGKLVMKTVPTNSPWFGVTYREDTSMVLDKLTELAPEYKFAAAVKKN